MTDEKRAADDALTVWRAIGEEAEAVVQRGVKYLLLSEEMCIRLGGALEAALSARADGGKDSSDARDAERYRRIRLGLSDVHGDVYAMVFAGDGDYPEDGDDLDRIVDAAIAREKI
ncbi:MAG: hypothetical protein WCD76_17680 [Pyrinomonadaceae bacterium]